MANTARDVIWPDDDQVVVRVVFLYVGQGDSSIVLVKEGDTYRTLLVDIDVDEEYGGVDVPQLMKDLLEDEGGKLGVFVNTHPHNDHLGRVVELADEVDIQEVWHSGHKPGKKHQGAYQDLQKVIKKVKKNHGDDAESELEGSRSAKAIGEAEYYVLAPAKHVKDDIDDESDDERYRRIHEQCAVLKFGKGDAWVMLTGDADRDAWEKHITEYHKDRLGSPILSAAHHGSKTFFRYDDKDEPYKDALKKIDPTYVVVSAPTSKESPHDHPHDDAMEFYEDQVGDKDNVLHLGKNRECVICDIFEDGDYQVWTDKKLVRDYGSGKKKDQGGTSQESKARAAAPAAVAATRVDHRPMG